MPSTLFTDYILIFLSSNFSNSHVKNWARGRTWKQSTFMSMGKQFYVISVFEMICFSPQCQMK